VSNLVLTLLVVRREWAFVDFGDLRFLAGGRAAGTVVAAGVLASLSQVLFDLLFATLVLIAVGLSLLRGGFPRSGRNLTLAGFASGLMGTLSSIGGPPVALIYQGVDPPRFRATLGVLLVLGATLSIAATWVVGRFGDTEVILSAVIVPAAFVGFWLSRFGIHWANGPRVRVAVLVLSTRARAVDQRSAWGAGADSRGCQLACAALPRPDEVEHVLGLPRVAERILGDPHPRLRALRPDVADGRQPGGVVHRASPHHDDLRDLRLVVEASAAGAADPGTAIPALRRHVEGQGLTLHDLEG
jgi:hypothetical protein